jgi:hypothetical protein
VVTHARNPSYKGGGDGRIEVIQGQPRLKKMLVRPILKNELGVVVPLVILAMC